MLTYNVDFCVVGGGLAGICAAVSAARNGASVAIMQERPVFGGNASSEIRMWVCGASGSNNRETGILEEINLENLYRNPYKIYSVWDSVLYEKVRFEKNIVMLLNCSCYTAELQGGKIISVTGWQMTTQEHIKITAKYFSDCSGDSVLAPLTGANFRTGRESSSEFGETVSISESDRKTMGMSCLIQARKTDRPIKYTAPDWALKLTAEDMKRRRPNPENEGENFWYLELGGDRDSIGDTETVRDELLALAFGYWDYYKNSGEFDSSLWQLDFVGFLPGKRESRRMVGKYIMNQNDIAAGGVFEDTIAYGGWPLDDHDPNGFWFSGKPCVQIPTPSPYGIPYRCVYSENIENLFFAGRNISMTHAAMSSSRVMATCALLGQAVGTAAAVANKYNCCPNDIYLYHIDELKQKLMFDDCMLPGSKRVVSDITLNASLSIETNNRFESKDNIENLRDGFDRKNVYTCFNGDILEYSFDKPCFIKEVRIVFDSDLDRNTLPGNPVERQHSMRANILPDSPVMCMPKTLCRSFSVIAENENGIESIIFETTQNRRRLITAPINLICKSVRLKVNTNWDDDILNRKINIFSFELY